MIEKNLLHYGRKGAEKSKYTCAEIVCYLNIHKATYLALSFETSAVFFFIYFPHNRSWQLGCQKNGFCLNKCISPAAQRSSDSLFHSLLVFKKPLNRWCTCNTITHPNKHTEKKRRIKMSVDIPGGVERKGCVQRSAVCHGKWIPEAWSLCNWSRKWIVELCGQIERHK